MGLVCPEPLTDIRSQEAVTVNDETGPVSRAFLKGLESFRHFVGFMASLLPISLSLSRSTIVFMRTLGISFCDALSMIGSTCCGAVYGMSLLTSLH
jgi:ABC-type transport system involved in Fe-S cluster assembly fused permease/ATPase subunit